MRKFYKRMPNDSAQPGAGGGWLGIMLFCAALLLAQGCRTSPRVTQKPETISLSQQADSSARTLALYSHGISRHEQGDLQDAARYLLQALELDPHSERVCRRLAGCFVDSDRVADGIEALSPLLQSYPESFPLQRWLALLSQLNGDGAAAERHYRRAIALESSAHEPPLELAVILLAQSRDSEAIAVLEAAESSVENPYEMAALRAGIHSRLAAKTENRTAAEQHRNEAISALESIPSPKNGAVRRRLALIQLYSLNHHYRAAFRVVADMLSCPGDERAKRAIAVYSIAILSRDQSEELAAAVDAARNKYSGSLSMLLFFGDLLSTIGRVDDALGRYLDAIEFPDAPADAYIKAALILLQTDEPSARELLDQGLDAVPDAPELWATRARLRMSKENHRAALSDLERTIELLRSAKSPNPKTLAVHIFWLGSCHERCGDLDRAAAAFEESIRLLPDFAEAYNYMAYMWAEAGIKLVQAREMVDEALRLEPENGAFVDTLAWIDHREGRHRKALENLKRAHRLVPDDPTVLDHLGDVYLALGRRDEAIDSWRRALDLNPENTKIEEKLERHTEVGI